MSRHFQCTVLLCLFAAALANAQNADKNYYPLKVDNKWTYVSEVSGKKLEAVVRIAGVDSKSSIARAETAIQGKVVTSEEVEQTDKGVFRHAVNGVKTDKPFTLLKYPIKQGETWSNDVTIADKQVKAESKVEAVDVDVKVPAGDFKAVKLVVDGEVDGTKMTTVMWFANDVGLIKQSVTVGDVSMSMELKEMPTVK